ncbi:MAG: hypothetical protein MUF51_07740, partial [Vicinamibacteria bacterium]|nr:hypothetical protein [Vicinamibacteria bacterium]
MERDFKKSRRFLSPHSTQALLAFVCVILGMEALFICARFFSTQLTFDVGPSTGAYLEGFTESEERPPITSRWTGAQGTIEIPLRAAAERATLVLHCARFIDKPVVIQIRVADSAPLAIQVRPGRFHLERLPLQMKDAPLVISFASETPGDPGLVLDWVRIENARFALPITVWGPRLLIIGIAVGLLIAGMHPSHAAKMALLIAAVAALWLVGDPFGMTHVLTRIGPPGAILFILIALTLRRRPHGHLIALVFLLGYLVKGAALFYPSFFYNDVRNNRRYVAALKEDGRSLTERNLAAQESIGVGYPRIIAGKKYAMPYSPLFFLAFTHLPEPRVEEALKHVVLIAAAAEVLVVFALATLLTGSGTGLYAALLASLMPITLNRLLLAMWVTMVGHFLDTLVWCTALVVASGAFTLPRMLLLWSALLAPCLAYVSSLFNLSAFFGLWASWDRKRRLALIAIWAGALFLTISTLYGPFVWRFIQEILPSLLTPHTSVAGTGVVPPPGILDALNRIPIFYGYGLPLIALAGLISLKRRVAPERYKIVLTYALTFIALVALRGFSHGLLKDLKEIEFVAPLVALLAGCFLEDLRDRLGRLVAALITLALLVISCDKLIEYFLAAT